MRFRVHPGASRQEVMFIPESGIPYWKSWWRAHFHIIRLIFQGHELEYDD